MAYVKNNILQLVGNTPLILLPKLTRAFGCKANIYAKVEGSNPSGSVKDRAALYMERNHRLLDMDLPFHKVGLAHFTCSLIVGECEGTSFEILDHISDGEYRELFDRAAGLGMGIELNMTFDEIRSESCLRPYRIAKECGCRFYLGSDAHTLGGFDSAERRFTAMIDALALTEDDKFRVFE